MLATLTGMRRVKIQVLQYANIGHNGGRIQVRRDVTYTNVNKLTIGTLKLTWCYRDILILAQHAALMPDCDLRKK